MQRNSMLALTLCATFACVPATAQESPAKALAARTYGEPSGGDDGVLAQFTGLLLELVRERVTASVVLQRRVITDGTRGLLVIGRRPPTGDGEVIWAYQFDAGVDPEDPAVAAAAAVSVGRPAGGCR